MDHHQTSNDEWADRHRQALTTRHSHEDVLNDREFDLLLEACWDLPAPRDFEARFICLLSDRLGLRAGEIAHFRIAWWIGIVSSSASQGMSPVSVDTASDRPGKKLPITTCSLKPTPSPPVSTPRPSPQLDQFPSTYRCGLSSVSSGLRIATMASHGCGQRSTDASRKSPTVDPLVVSIRTACVLPRPATTRTKASPPSYSKH